MSDDSRFEQLAALASERTPDEIQLHDLAMSIGAHHQGLRELVERFGDSANPVLVRYVAVPLARAPWDWRVPAAELNGIVLDFIALAGQTDDGPTLGGCLTALHGLSAVGLLAARSDRDKSVLGDFMLHCLGHADLNVRSGCLQLMSHLYVDHALERVVTSELKAAVKEQVVQLSLDEGDRLADDLESLRGFW